MDPLIELSLCLIDEHVESLGQDTVATSAVVVRTTEHVPSVPQNAELSDDEPSDVPHVAPTDFKEIITCEAFQSLRYVECGMHDPSAYSIV